MNATPQHRIYVRQSGKWSEGLHIQTPSALANSGIPVPFRIDSDVPLPDSVPINYLATGDTTVGVGRTVLRSIWDQFVQNPKWFDTGSSVQTNADAIASAFKQSRTASAEELDQYKLAHDLLIKVAGLKADLFKELRDAVKSKNGYANSLVDTINAELSKALNFPHWWSQDSQFELFVALYEFDLVFMIRDRTGRTYGFDERSDGMKYFLGYFVRYLAHEPRADGREEVLLMDEPDRFLSSSGQQDLLRIFEDFADPKDAGREPVQVVYVTHSPFLIDKNEADRIRVLEKGEFDEGTRVVKNSSANHYEPLRSAFGSFVAETAFIGNCNLMVEGASDQVLIGGASRWLKTRGVADRDRLDLNHITVVPAGGTRHIPYLVYLARGRDIEKPPVIVLVDNDKDGSAALADLAAGGAYGDRLLDPDLALQLGQGDLAGLRSDNPLGVAGLEDLVPIDIAIVAAAKYCEEFVPTVDPMTYGLDADSIFPKDAKENEGSHALLRKAIAKKSGVADFHLDKVAFARAVVDILISSPADLKSSIETFEKNMRLLLSVLALRQRKAERAESVDKISSRIRRAKRDFIRTHRDRARREDVLALIEEIGNQLDNSPEAEDCRATMRKWYLEFKLDEDPRSLIESFEGLMSAIDGLAYQALR
jgi:hypothetical protein